MGCCVKHRLFTKTIHKLFLTQKKAIMIITNSAWRAHTYPLFHKHLILKIEELHKLQVACFIFKVHNGLMPLYFANVFHEMQMYVNIQYWTCI